MATLIATANMNIDPELCKRLDKAIYGLETVLPRTVVDRANVIREELVDALRLIDPKIADHEKGSCLYRLCTVIESIRLERGREENERGRANMQTAHNQLKNWK